MVQVIENRADIEGNVLAVVQDETHPNHKVGTIDVTSVTSVEGYPNMFEHAAGTQLQIVIGAELASTLETGKKVRWRIRRAGPMTIWADTCSTR